MITDWTQPMTVTLTAQVQGTKGEMVEVGTQVSIFGHFEEKGRDCFCAETLDGKVQIVIQAEQFN